MDESWWLMVEGKAMFGKGCYVTGRRERFLLRSSLCSCFPVHVCTRVVRHESFEEDVAQAWPRIKHLLQYRERARTRCSIPPVR